MSDVHLSGAAAAPERLAALRALPVPGRSAVCRSLFGPVDHEELGRELRSRLREMGEDDQRRWDYNFHTDTPLPGPGRLRWEEVEGGTVPAFYRETLQISSPGGKGRPSPKRRPSAPRAALSPPPPCRLSTPPASGSAEPGEELRGAEGRGRSGRSLTPRLSPLASNSPSSLSLQPFALRHPRERRRAPELRAAGTPPHRARPGPRSAAGAGTEPQPQRPPAGSGRARSSVTVRVCNV
uniref:Cyclin dependent kinase inhibitor 1C n=1 Tax=Gallus gallus TaxID=9031 RepID=A0A8V0ZW32_CHICK